MSSTKQKLKKDKNIRGIQASSVFGLSSKPEVVSYNEINSDPYFGSKAVDRAVNHLEIRQNELTLL